MASTSNQGLDRGVGKPTKGDMNARSKLSRSLQSIMVGLARTFDFSNALKHRTATRSAEEDMALAWREVYSGLPPLHSQVSQSEQEPPAEGADTLTESGDVTKVYYNLGNVVNSGSISVWHREIGYRGPTACAAAGITYRQLDYWARTGLVEPSVRMAHSSGSQRLYSFRDVFMLKVIKRLLDTGIPLQQIRLAVQYLRDRRTEDLA